MEAGSGKERKVTHPRMNAVTRRGHVLSHTVYCHILAWWLHLLRSTRTNQLVRECSVHRLRKWSDLFCIQILDMSNDTQADIHLKFLRIALDEARKCIPTPTAFCVGAVLTVCHPAGSEPVVLATGYSRELPGNTHAEANALAKARSLSNDDLNTIFPSLPAGTTVDELLAGADIYTTMEPCSIRTSGLAPCAGAVIAARIRRCFIGVGEPDDFVNCEGAQKLKDANVEVVWISGLEKECLEVARTGH